LAPHLDERGLRLWVAAEAIAVGYGGVAAVARATGVAASGIRRGRRELLAGEVLERGRVRRPGAGRRPLTEKAPRLLEDLEGLVDADTRGDPQSPLRWTSKSQRRLAEGLRALGDRIGARSVAPLLVMLGFSLQANRKVREGSRHPDRDAQFRYVNEITELRLAVGEPVSSIDTKKKELVGDFKNGGRERRRKGRPERVRVHDFKDKQFGQGDPARPIRSRCRPRMDHGGD
jgi:hypothetical protein